MGRSIMTIRAYCAIIRMLMLLYANTNTRVSLSVSALHGDSDDLYGYGRVVGLGSYSVNQVQGRIACEFSRLVQQNNHSRRLRLGV